MTHPISLFTLSLVIACDSFCFLGYNRRNQYKQWVLPQPILLWLISSCSSGLHCSAPLPQHAEGLTNKDQVQFPDWLQSTCCFRIKSLYAVACWHLKAFNMSGGGTITVFPFFFSFLRCSWMECQVHCDSQGAIKISMKVLEMAVGSWKWNWLRSMSDMY